MRHQHERTTKPMTWRRALKKGEPHRRVIGRVAVRGVEYTLHATKGYRATRA